jgi:long-chain acyl-CoA synthetase
VGKPLPSVELRARGGRRDPRARARASFGGYHKDPEAAREAFTADGWFKTGDVGRFTDDGFLQIVDRKKDILVTAGGKNVPPANIELRFATTRCSRTSSSTATARSSSSRACGSTRPRGASSPRRVARRRGDVDALVQGAHRGVNASSRATRRIKKFAIIDRPLTVENGLLTATLKVRRKKVYEAFRDAFEALYE